MAGAEHEVVETKGPLRGWMKLAMAVLVFGFLAAAVASQWSRLDDADLRFAPLWLVSALPLLLLFQLSQGEAALIILRRLEHPLEPVRGRSIYGAALLARYIPTGAVSILLRVALNEREGVPKRISTIALVYEVALALVAAAVSAVPLLPSVGTAAIAVAAIPVAGVAALHPRMFSRIVAPLLRRARQPDIGRMLSFRDVLLLIGLLVLGFWAAGIALLFTLLAITPVHGGEVAIISTFGLGFITSMVGFALPGGLGAREAGLVAGLSVSTATPLALAAAALSRLVQTAVELLYAAGATLHERLGRRS